MASSPSASLRVGLCPLELKYLHPANSLSVSLMVTAASGPANWEEMTGLGADKLLTGAAEGRHEPTFLHTTLQQSANPVTITPNEGLSELSPTQKQAKVLYSWPDLVP